MYIYKIYIFAPGQGESLNLTTSLTFIYTLDTVTCALGLVRQFKYTKWFLQNNYIHFWNSRRHSNQFGSRWKGFFTKKLRLFKTKRETKVSKGRETCRIKKYLLKCEWFGKEYKWKDNGHSFSPRCHCRERKAGFRMRLLSW